MLTKELIFEEQAFIEQVKAFESSAHFRQALLLRLCFQGTRLESALRFTKKEFFIEESKPGSGSSNQRIFQSKAFELDSGVQTGHSVLDLLTHVAGLDWRKSAHAWIDTPLFGSRKGNHPILPRTAQRLLKIARNNCKLTKILGFRDAYTLGKRLKIARDQHSRMQDAAATEIGTIMQSIRWFFVQAFENVHDREEAEQDTRMRLVSFIYSTQGDLSPAFLKGTALRIARNLRYSFLSEKRSKPETLYRHFDAMQADSAFMSEDSQESEEALWGDHIAHLRDDEREVIRHLYLRGFDIDLTAIELNMPPSYVQRTKRRAIQKLRQLIKNDESLLGRLIAKRKTNPFQSRHFGASKRPAPQRRKAPVV
jgi:RNA polymerase sigma factor (sigma-70 family)